MENTKHVVQVSSNISEQCKDCGIHPALEPGPDIDVAKAINHYLNHGYKLLHVGTQTCQDLEGKLWHNTTAILGK